MSLLNYLPAIFQDQTDGDDPSRDKFLERFLEAFETILLSRRGERPSESHESGGSGGDAWPGRPPGGQGPGQGESGAPKGESGGSATEQSGRGRNAESGAGRGGSEQSGYRGGGNPERSYQTGGSRGSGSYGGGSPEAGYREGGDSLGSFRESGFQGRGSPEGGTEIGPDAAIRPLEDEIEGIHRLFDAETTPREFLSWLAGWVALALRTDLSPARQRRVLANTVRLYRIRGTRRGMEEILKLYLEALPSVTDEDLPAMQIIDHSTVGADTYLGGGPSFLFQVKLAFSQKEATFVARQSQLAREVIELERPAHTWYDLRTSFPRTQIGVHSTVGVDTVLRGDY